MTNQTAQSQLRIPLVLLGAGFVLSGLAAAATSVAMQGQDAWTSAATGGACISIAGLLGLVAYRCAGPRGEHFGFAVIGSSTARMFLGLLAGLLLVFTVVADRAAFWIAFLTGGLLALAIETALGMNACRAPACGDRA